MAVANGPTRASRQSLVGRAGHRLIAEEAEFALAVKKSQWYTVHWRKWHDAPLADIVENRPRRWERAGMDDAALVQARIGRIRRHGRG